MHKLSLRTDKKALTLYCLGPGYTPLTNITSYCGPVLLSGENISNSVCHRWPPMMEMFTILLLWDSLDQTILCV